MGEVAEEGACVASIVATIFRSFAGNETVWPSGNILNITMAWKTSCKDVATLVGRLALHITFCMSDHPTPIPLPRK